MKRGQAGNIATLISLIALFMLVYILLLPQEARDDLLQRNEAPNVGGGLNNENSLLLFSKNIGELTPLRQSKGIIHTIAGVNLYSDTKNEILTLANDIKFSRSVTNDNSQVLDFPIDFPKDVLRAELYIIVDEAEGDLIIVLNGREIFNSDVLDNSQEVINLPLNLLKEINVLEFKSQSPGSQFWKINSHDLREVRLRKQAEVKNRESLRVISIPASELRDLEKSILSFSVFCSQDERDKLNVKVNQAVVYSDVPFCNLKRSEIEIDRDFVNSGNNNLLFESEGDYIIEEVEWQSLLRGQRASEYAFDIKNKDYRDVRRGKGEVYALFEFALSDNRKTFDFYINDEKFEVNTLNDDFTIVISDYLEDGSNLMKLRPRNSFELIDLRIELD
jgi:hypothetical protein